MQTAMLLDNSPTVNANNLSVRESLLDDVHRLLVKVWLVVGGHQYSTVDDQVVGIGGRQTVAIIVEDGAG